jgi:hypothetical protein
MSVPAHLRFTARIAGLGNWRDHEVAARKLVASTPVAELDALLAKVTALPR